MKTPNLVGYLKTHVRLTSALQHRNEVLEEVPVQKC